MALPATDTFTGADGTHLTAYSANWSACQNILQIHTNAVAPHTYDECGAYWNADAFNADQYAEGTFTAVASGHSMGVAVRGSSTNYYGFYSASDANSAQLFKVVAGVFTQLGSGGAAFAVSNVIYLSVSGVDAGTLTPKKNGALLNPPNTQTDSALDSGSAGLSGYGDISTRLDNWEGGNLGGSASPSGSPSGSPSHSPSHSVSASPSEGTPSASPSEGTPSASPSEGTPSASPSEGTPSASPSEGTPSASPSHSPSASPSEGTPSASPSEGTPSASPSEGTPSASPSEGTPSASPSEGTPSASPSEGTPSASPSEGTPSASPSEGTPSASPSEGTPSASPSEGTPSASPSEGTPSASPSEGTPSASPSEGTPSASPSEGTPSFSPSHSPSASPSEGTPSASPSEGTPSASPSEGTPSASPSEGTPSASPSEGTPSASPSASGEPPEVCPVCWGHVTGVTETVLTFAGNWAGTGAIAGVGDAEVIELNAGEYMISEVVDTGATTVTLEQNFYDPTGDDVDMDYRHGATEAACLGAAWNNYGAPFASLGYIQVRLTSTL